MNAEKNPQTAEAINAPQTGKLNLPTIGASQAPVPFRARTTKQPGWWSLDTSGLRAGVLRDIDAAADIPDYDKAFLRAHVAALPAEHNFVDLDAHCQVEGGRRQFHHTILGRKVSV